MNTHDIIVIDFETGSAVPETTVPLSIAAKAFHPRSLRPIPDAEFSSLMRPKDEEFALIQAEALAVNGIKIDDLKVAPERAQVWSRFVSFVNAHNFRKTPWTAPIFAGHNILTFDLVIIDRLCKEHGQVDKDGRQNLYNRRDKLDLLPLSLLWFENAREPANYKLDTLRDYFGMSKEGAHTAIQDVRDSGDIIMRFLQLHRTIAGKVTFKGAFGTRMAA